MLNLFDRRPHVTPILVGLVLVSLSACNLFSPPTPSSDNQPPASTSVSLDQIIHSSHPLIYLDGQTLSVIDVQAPQPLPLVSLTADQLPSYPELFLFLLSPSRRHVVWYSPNSGVLKLDLKDLSISSLRPPGFWLNQNPHLAMHPARDLVYFIDSQGQELISVDLDTHQLRVTPIPFPFGNLFQIAPNGNSIVYVSGFDQTPLQPEYMITSLSGESPFRFSTQAPLNKREFIRWVPDSSALIFLSSDSQISLKPMADLETESLLFDLSQEGTIVELDTIDSLLYVLTSNQQWHLFDLVTNQLVGRTSTEIASDIHRPKFYPWHQNSFLIQETIRLDPLQFHRLWLSDIKGIKHQLIDKYHEINLQTDAPAL